MCLQIGYFSRSTLKPLDKIYNLNSEKKILAEYIQGGEWFTVAGLRRVRKTTLVRSIVSHLGIDSIYLNLWEIDYDRAFEEFIFRITRELLSLKDSSWRRKLKSLEELSIMGFKIRIRKENVEFYLSELLDEILSKKRVVMILDEVYTLERDLDKLLRFLAVLHDEFAPRLSVVLLGSIVSVKLLFDKRGEEIEPLYGRLVREFILKPFDRGLARQFLLKGFEECGVGYRGIHSRSSN